LRETSVSLFILYCQYVLLLSALGGGLGRPRRLGIPSPEGERRMTNAHLKVLHFDLESSVKAESNIGLRHDVLYQNATSCPQVSARFSV
ncbi:hypothetical protein, partial [Duncaniella muris]|uniref:hypothetical protein n=1 Tax=Duncaniella muris TaxID=2094150 RepID=UPI0025B6863A